MKPLNSAVWYFLWCNWRRLYFVVLLIYPDTNLQYGFNSIRVFGISYSLSVVLAIVPKIYISWSGRIRMNEREGKKIWCDTDAYNHFISDHSDHFYLKLHLFMFFWPETLSRLMFVYILWNDGRALIFINCDSFAKAFSPLCTLALSLSQN